MNREQINKIKEITDFDELWEIQNKAWDETISTDLMLIREFHYLADTCIIIIGPNALDYLKIYKISHENYNKFSPSQKEYIKQYY